MRKATIGLGVAVIALAGGVTFCANAFDEPFDVVSHHDGTTNEPGPGADDEVARERSKPFPLTLTVATEDSPQPSFVGFRDGDNGWRHPSVDRSTLELEVYDPHQRYSVLTACAFDDAKGKPHVDVTLIEATVAELSNPRVICRARAEDERDVQLAGAIRGTGGADINVSIGTRRFTVENEKNADGVLFSTDVARGTHAVAATRGSGPKAKTAVARGVDLKNSTGKVEIDFAEDTVVFAPVDLDVLSPPTSQLLGGRSFIWLDGRTRFARGRMLVKPTAEGLTLSVPSTSGATDVLDITAQFRMRPSKPGETRPVAAQGRILTPADGEASIAFPDVSGATSSDVRVRDAEVDIAWNVQNWSVFGYDDAGDLALYMPAAYVARLTQRGETRRTLDVVVTPNRATGPNPEYTVPNFASIEHFDAGWAFRPDSSLHVSAGNLTANAGSDRVFGSEAIGAYLESEAVHGPATFVAKKTLTTLVTGLPPVLVDATTDFSDLREQACVDAAECIAKVQADPKALKVCDALAVYRDCEATKRIELAADKGDFADDLRREITAWYVSPNVELTDDAKTLDEALASVSEERVKEMKPLEWGERFTYDLAKYQVFHHVDPIYPDSRGVWYGAYLFGRLVAVTPVNLDYGVRDLVNAEDAELHDLLATPELETEWGNDWSYLKDAWPTVIPSTVHH